MKLTWHRIALGARGRRNIWRGARLLPVAEDIMSEGGGGGERGEGGGGGGGGGEGGGRGRGIK